jgi:hypothetical protein
MNNLLEMTKFIQDQGAQGVARREKNNLRNLSAQYFSGGQQADPDFLGQVAQQAGPDTAVLFQKNTEDQKAAKLKDLGQASAYFLSLTPEQQAAEYPNLAQKVVGAGLPAPPPFDPQHAHLEPIAKLASMFGGAADDTPADVKSARYFASHPQDLAAWQQMNEAKRTPNYGQLTQMSVTLPDGTQGTVPAVWKDGQLTPYTPGSNAPQTAPSAPQAAPSQSPTNPIPNSPGGFTLNPSGDIPQLASLYGAQITSGFRTPEHNAELPGSVPNSWHTRGDPQHPMAYDLVAPPDKKPQLVATLRSKGYTVLDTPANPQTGEGAHLHVQPPRGYQGGSGGAGGLPYGFKPTNAGGQGEIAKRVKEIGDLQAQGVTFTPEQRQIYLTSGKLDASGATGATADNPLGGLNPADAAFVKKLSSGLALPSDMGARTATGMSRADAMGRAILLNPDWSPDWARQVKKFSEDLAATSVQKPGGLILSMGTILHHLGTMIAADKNLKTLNVPGALQFANTGLNALKTGKEQQALQRWEQGKSFISQELGKLVKGGAITQAENEELQSQLTASGSQAKRDAALSAVAEFAYGRIAPIEKQRTDLLQSVAPNTSLMTAEEQRNLAEAYQLGGLDPPDMLSPDTGQGQIKPSNAANAAPKGAPTIIRYDAQGNRIP